MTRILSIAFAALCFGLAQPSLAQQETEFAFQPLDAALVLDRGVFEAESDSAYYLGAADACEFAKGAYGWTSESCADLARIVFEPTPEIDTIVIRKPISDGFVTYEDWRRSDRDVAVDEIWDGVVASLRAQSEQLGVAITATDWLVYPTLDEKRNILYYAFAMNWDGEIVVNLETSVFDRQGYVAFSVVPLAETPSAEEVRSMARYVADGYRSRAGQRYADFRDGDLVYQAGAVGVLATLVGVKYGKEIAGGLLATLLVFAKKAWFLFLLPIVWVARLFRRGGDR